MMPAQLSLSIDKKAKSADDHTWLTLRDVNDSPLDFASKFVYLKQLDELQTKLASYDECSVEYFVTTQSLEELTVDFWAAVQITKQDRQQQQRQTLIQGPDSADLSHHFRRLDLS